jgi:serine/threonine protein kinase
MLNKGKILKNQYEIKEELGKGGFGKTYLAIDTQRPDEREVVIKQFLPSRQYDDEMMARLRRWFDREAELLRQLGRGCRLVPQRYDFFEEDGKVYIVQEFVEGSDLNNFIGKDKILSEKNTIEIIKNILIALEFVHQKNIRHLDLKPTNLRVRKVNDEEDEIVLLDFGIAREIQDDLQSLSEVIGVGTKGYMPPEQRKDGRQTTLASDIYPIGIIGLQAITGLGISYIGDLESGSIRLKDGTISPDAKIQASPQLIRFLSKTLAEDPLKRFANAMEALKALENLYETEIELPPTDVETSHTNVPKDLPPTVVPSPDRKAPVAASTLIGGKPLDQLASTVRVDDKPPTHPKTKPNRSKHFWLMPLGAIVIAGGIGAGWLMWPKWITPPSRYGIVYSFPQNWTQETEEPEQAMGSVAILHPPDQKSECGDTVEIKKVKRDDLRGLNDLKLDTIDRIKKSNHKVNIDDQTTIDTQLSVFPAFRLNYQREDALCGSRQIIEVGTIISNSGALIADSKVYSVLYNSNAQTANKNRATFDKILEQFKLEE